MSDPDKWGIDLTPDEADTFMAAICEARRGPDLPDPLVALRAEVEAMRDGCLLHWRSASYALPEAQPEARAWIAGREQTIKDVLDLIDKHAREGQ